MSGKEHDDGLDASFIISQAKSRNRPLHPYTPEKEEEASALSEPSGEAASSSATKEEDAAEEGKARITSVFLSGTPPPIPEAAKRCISARSFTSV